LAVVPEFNYSFSHASLSETKMSRWEKVFCVFYFVYLVAYVPYFIFFFDFGPLAVSLHLFGMFLGLPLLFVVFRDLYKRHFKNPNDKITWTLLILLLSPFGIIAYLFCHGFRPRPRPD
jgi:hypothetical protein